MSQDRRSKRLASLIRAELGKLALEELADPMLAGMAITDVKVTPDLKKAHVYFNLHSEPASGEVASIATPSATPAKKPSPREQKKTIDKALKRVLPFFRRRIGEQLSLRYVPELEFEQDYHTDRVTHLYGLLDQINDGSRMQAPVEVSSSGENVK